MNNLTQIHKLRRLYIHRLKDSQTQPQREWNALQTDKDRRIYSYQSHLRNYANSIGRDWRTIKPDRIPLLTMHEMVNLLYTDRLEYIQRYLHLPDDLETMTEGITPEYQHQLIALRETLAKLPKELPDKLIDFDLSDDGIDEMEEELSEIHRLLSIHTPKMAYERMASSFNEDPLYLLTHDYIRNEYLNEDNRLNMMYFMETNPQHTLSLFAHMIENDGYSTSSIDLFLKDLAKNLYLIN